MTYRVGPGEDCDYPNLMMWLAWHLPKSIAYWAAIRVMTKDYGGSPSDQTCEQALRRWE